MDDSYSDSKVFKSPSFPPPQINYMMKTSLSAAAFCPVFLPPTGIVFFFFLNYLFIWLRGVLVVACGIFLIASCRIFPCGTRTLVVILGSVVAPCWLSSCGRQAF